MISRWFLKYGCPRTVRRSVLYLVWAVCSAGFVVFVLESSARIFLDVASHRFLLFVPAETGLYRLRPGFDEALPIRMQKDAPEVEIRTGVSIQGLRDREFGDKRKGEFRILMLGDSQTFGWGLEKDQSAPKALERVLRQRFPERDITVVNGGVPGYGPWEALAWLKDDGAWLQPDMVILQTFLANDLSDSLEQLTPGIQLLEAYHDYRVRLVWRLRHHDAWPMALDNWLLAHSHVYHLLWKQGVIDTPCCQMAAYLPFAPRVTMPRLPESANRLASFEADRVHWYPNLEKAWRLFAENIDLMANHCKGLGIGFAVYNIPYPFDLNHPDALGPSKDMEYAIDSAERRFQSYIQAQGYLHATMLASFREAPRPSELAFAANQHLTTEGVRLVVAEIQRQFLDAWIEKHPRGTSPRLRSSTP